MGEVIPIDGCNGAYRVSKTAYQALGVTLLLQIWSAVLFKATPVIAPALPAEMGVDKAFLGIFGSLIFLGAMFGSPMAALFVTSRGGVRMIQLGLLTSCIGLLTILTGIGPILLCAAIFIGFGYSPNAPGGSYVLSRHTPVSQRGLIFSIKQAGVPLGGALVGLVVPVIERQAGWPTAMLTVIISALIIVGFVGIFRRNLDDEEDRTPDPNPRQVLRQLMPLHGLRHHPLLPRISTMAAVYGGGQMVLFTYLVFYLTERVELTLISAGAAYAALQISSFVMRIASGWLNDRLRKPRLMLALFGLVTAVTIYLLTTLNAQSAYETVVILSAVAGAGAAGWNGVFLSEVARVTPPEHVAEATGAAVFCIYFGLVLGPLFFGFTAEVLGYDFAFTCMAIITAIGSICVFWPMGRKPG